jgi:tetratricopeptide (TPR) repeat protein
MCASRKVRTAGVAVLGTVLSISGCAFPLKPQLSANAQAEALSHFSLGLLAESNGDSSGAFDQLKAAIKLDPNEQKLYAPAVAIAIKLKKQDEAIQLARELVKRQPGTVDPLLLLARVYALTEHPDQAEALFKQAFIKFPERQEPPIFLTRFYLSQERRADAVNTLYMAVKAQSNNADLLHLLGTLCIDNARSLGDAPQAKVTIQEGISFLQKASTLAPTNTLLWQQLGFALIATGKPAEALNAFKTAHQYAPSDLLTARQIIDLLITTGNADHALAIYEQMADETGTEPEPWIQYIAEKLPKDEQYRLIARLEDQIVKQQKAPVFFYTQLSSLYIGAHRNQDAETLLTKALEHYPGNNRLRIVRGYLHLQQERYHDAYVEFEHVRTTSPESEWAANPFFLFNFLIAAQKSGYLEEAAKTLASTYIDNPVILNQYMQSILTKQTSISTESSIELLTIFHTMSPEATEALYYLMVLQAEQKQYDKAIETARKFENVVQKSGNTNLLSGQFYYQYASLYERTGQLDAAEKLFLKIIETGGDFTAPAQNYIAYMWAERGEKLDAGLELIRKALAVSPENGAFRDTLGWIYYMQGRHTEALNELQKAIDLIKDDPVIREHLGDTYFKLGNHAAAVEQWKKALELNPENKRVREQLKSNGITPDEHPAASDNPADTTLRP